VMPWPLLLLLSSEREEEFGAPFTDTVTVSTLPAPFGPSMRLLLSVRRSLAVPFPSEAVGEGLPAAF